VIRDNSVCGFGGGLYNDGTATLTDVIVSGNRSQVGGGLANFGTLALNNVTIGGNSARFASGLFNRRTATLIRRWRSAGTQAVTPPATATPDRAAHGWGAFWSRPGQWSFLRKTRTPEGANT
jgi:hypothetical protein